jgi:hypothetical protein
MKMTMLQKAIEVTAGASCKLSRQKYGTLWAAYEKSCLLLSRLADQGARDADGESQFQAERLSLTANVLEGCFIVEALISSGYYVASIAVLRQHMEMIARIIELRSGVQTNRTPNVRCLPFSLSRNTVL